MKTILGNSLRASKWFKPAVIAGGVIVLLLLGLLAIPPLIDINTYRDRIASQLEKTLGRPVQLGAMKLRVLPSIKVAVEQVRIGEDPKVAQGDFVTARAVRLQMGLMSLLKGAPEVSGIELDEPVITLIRQPDAQWNWSTLKPLQSTEGQSAQPPFDLRVRNGKFTLIDRSVTPPTERNYTGVNVSLDDFSPRQAFNAAIRLKMPGEEGGTIAFEGQAGPIDKTDATRTPIDARIRMEAVDLASLETLLGDGGTQGRHAGILTSDVKLEGKLAEELRANGTIKAEQLRLVQGVEPARLPLEAEFALRARSEKNAAGEALVSAAISLLQLRVGGTKADITGRIDRLPAQPAVDLQVKGEGVSLENLLESAYAFGFGPPAGTKAGGTANFDLHATGDAQAPALNGHADFRDLKFQNGTMPQPVTVSELRVAFNPYEITATPFRATLSRTTVELNNLRITNYSKQARAHLDVATANAQVDDLIRIAESFGARPGITAASGNASLKAAVDANLGGAARAMTINGSGKLSGARLQAAGAAKPIEIANADLGFTGDSLRVDNLALKFGGSQISGWLQARDFDRPNATFDLKANQLSLAEMQQSLGAASAGASGGGAASSMTATGQIAIGKLLLDSLTATDVQSKVTLVNQILSLDPMTLKLYGGAYQGSVRVNSAGAAPEIALNGNFNGLDINQFLSASGQRSSIHGRANGALNVRGQGDGSSDGLARSLVGNGAIAINDGKFASFDLMKQVEVLGKLYNLPTGGAGTAFRSLKTNLVFERGRMRTDALQILMDDLQVNGNGAIQLGDAPTIDYDLIIKLSQGLTRRVSSGGGGGGGGAAGLLAGLANVSSKLGNFFADSDSTLAIPIKMSGPLKQPVFGLNSAVLQQRAKTRLTERLVEGFTKDAGKEPATEPGKEPAKEPAKPKPVDLLKGVLEGLKRKEKPQP